MTLESWNLSVLEHVPPEARAGRYGAGSVSYPAAHDPTHMRAWHDVEHGTVDYAEVRYDPPAKGISFRAWRVSQTSWAWQTAAMGAPAFARYSPHDAPVTDSYGTFCPGCRSPLSRREVEALAEFAS